MNDIERDYAFGIIPFYRQSLAEYIFFIGKTQSGDGRKSLWKFPKGHKDYSGEDEVAAAVRELKEETGIEISRAAVILSTSFTEQYFYERRKNSPGEHSGIIKKLNTFWLGQVANHGSSVPEVVLDTKEFIEYKWASYQEVLALLPENSLSFFNEANDFLVRNRV